MKGTATGAEIYKTWADERTLLIARILAETCVKELFWKILELVSKHQTAPQIVKLRNQWVQVDPREWKNKFNMTVTVGLGTGSQQTVLQGAMGIMGIQFEMLKAGMGGQTVTPENFYNSAKEYSKAVFPKKSDQFFTDPKLMPPPQPQIDPDLQLKAQKVQMSDAQKRDKMQQESQMHAVDVMKELEIQKRELAHDTGRVGAEQAHDSRMKGADMAHEAGMGAVQMSHDMNKTAAKGNGGAASSPSPQIIVDQNEGLKALAEALQSLVQVLASQSNARTNG